MVRAVLTERQTSDCDVKYRIIHSRFSGNFMYTGLKQVENMYDDFVKVMPK